MRDKNGMLIVGGNEASDAFNELLAMIKHKKTDDVINSSEVIKRLDSFLTDEQHIKFLEIGDTFYRARCVSHKDYVNAKKGFSIINGYLSGFNEEQSGAPKPRKKPVGRCDISNIVALYAASDIETACCEVRPLFKELISVATYSVQEQLKLFDITRSIPKPDTPPISMFKMIEHEITLQFWELLIDTFEREFRKEHYEVSQYIAKYIYSKGFNGIIHHSSQGQGLNIIIYNPTKDTIQWMGSKMYVCSHKELDVTLLNEQIPMSPSKKCINANQVKNIKNNVIQRIKRERALKTKK